MSEENKQKRGGPRTPAGKRWSSRNAVTHGLSSEVPALLRSEREEAFTALSGMLRDEYDPVGPVESLLCDRISWCWWRLWRAGRIEQSLIEGHEAAAASRHLRRAPLKVMWIDTLTEDRGAAQLADADALHNTLADPQAEARAAREALARFGLDGTKLVRYEAAVERSLYRAMKELQGLQDRRRAAAKLA